MAKKNGIKLLHITPHFGGGVGTVLLANLLHSNKTDPDVSASVICLDYLNDHAKAAITEAGISYLDSMHTRPEEVLKLIGEADITVVHWWNHPLLTDFLVRQSLPPCRLIFWCHITGSQAPNNLTPRLMTYPDYFVFATPVSYGTQEYKNLSTAEKSKVSTIWSTAGAERLSHLRPKKHEGFHVGYIGSLDPAKISPNFIDLCKAINIPDVHFTVIGSDNQTLMDETKAKGMADKITFTGFVPEPWEQLAAFDVFGYPLARHHFGSCDQTIQEAMTVGVPPVVLDNAMESHMVRHNDTGLIARGDADYVHAIETLYHNPELRLRLGQSAKKFAELEYSIEGSCRNWKAAYDKVMENPKSSRSWGKFSSPPSPMEVFVESLGSYAGPFEKYLNSIGDEIAQSAEALRELAKLENWASPNKSTVHQFHRFFPNDPILREWAQIMKARD